MTYEEAIKSITPGKYRHFKGNEYEVVSIAHHSETMEALVVYQALYGDHGYWVRPADMWFDIIDCDGNPCKRFEKI